MSGLATQGLSLRAAARVALAGDGALAAILGGPKVYSEAPKDAVLPYVVLDDGSSLDESVEQGLTLHAWSRQGGHGEAHAIAGALLGALDEMPLMGRDDTPMSLRFSLADIRREAGRVYHTTVRFHAGPQD